MSRCFPFPPPGYERKPRSDDVDLLAKEKDKKNKHKKEKSDKEKRDGKERKHYDKKKDKHKDKKDRKEKHKEKRRHKRRDEEKISDRPIEQRAQDQSENKICDSSKDLAEVKDSKFMEEFAKRYKNNDAAKRIFENGNSSTHMSEGFGRGSSMEKERDSRMGLVANDTNNQSRNGGPYKYSDQKMLQENIKAKEMSPLTVHITNTDSRKYDEPGMLMEKDFNKKNAKGQQALGRYDMDTSNGHENQKRNNVLGQPVQKGAEKTECKEVNYKQKMAESIVKCQTNNERLHQTFADIANEIEVGQKTKLGEVDGGTHNHHNNIDRDEKKHKKDKEKHKKEMEKDKNNKRKHKHKEHKSSNIQDNHQLVTQFIATTTKDNGKYADVEENLKRRKDQPINGLLYESDQRPNKIPRPIENGRMIEQCHLPAPSPSKHGGVNSNFEEHLVLNKSKHVMNGALSVGSVHSIPADMNRNGGTCLKTPHPDSKYLNTVYSVPKMEDWLEFDNQDWLFHGDVSKLKPKEDGNIKEMIPQVWSEGRKIESADVFALPYVIPY